MATDEAARATWDAKLDALHEKLAGAVEQVVSGDDWRRALEFAARFRSRSFGNTLLIWAQHLDAHDAGRVPEPDPTYVAGYKQWQSLGRQVDKGQPGYMIFAPVTGRFASSSPSDPESWRRLDRFEKPKPGEVVRFRMVGAKPAYVWDVSQTSGGPVPERPRPVLLEGEAPDGLWDGLARLVEAVHERADPEREEDRAEADGAAEQPAGEQNGCLDDEPRRPDRPAEACAQPRHEAVTRAGTEVGADVQARGDGDEHHAEEEHEHLQREPVDRGKDGERRLHARADEQDVREGADARLLTQGDPQQQNEEADDVRDPPDPDAGLQ